MNNHLYEWETWKTIEVGKNHETEEDIYDALVTSDFKMDSWTSAILRLGNVFHQEQGSINLVTVSGEELGFVGRKKYSKRIMREQVYRWAHRRGLLLCAPEIALQLRLQYPDQQRYEWLIVGMEPITSVNGYPLTFHLEHRDSGKWIEARYAEVQDTWSVHHRWVFVLPRGLYQHAD